MECADDSVGCGCCLNKFTESRCVNNYHLDQNGFTIQDQPAMHETILMSYGEVQVSMWTRSVGMVWDV